MTFQSSLKRFCSVVVVVGLGVQLLAPVSLLAASITVRDKNATMQEDGINKAIPIAATGSRGETFTYSITQNPTSGSVSLSGSVTYYTPAANYNGTDTFKYRAVGSINGTSSEATVTITVNSVNDSPVATSGIVANTTKNTPVTFTVGGTDIETSSLSCSLGSISNGSASISGCQVTYDPSNNFTGTGSVNFRVFDGSAYSSYVTASINVTDTNTAPTATSTSIDINEDQTRTINLIASDVDGQTLSYSIATNPLHGSLSTLSSTQVSYSPTANYCGSDSFTYVANDGTLISAPATVTIEIACLNDIPTATSGLTLTMNENTTQLLQLSASDVDGDSLTYETNASAFGSWSVNPATGLASFTPNQNFEGTTNLLYRVFDGTAYSNYASVFTTVNRVNLAPTAFDVNKEIVEDNIGTILLDADDSDLDSLSYRVVTQPANGSVTINGPQASYTPDLNYNGSDSFTYVANDGAIDSNIATVYLSITEKNDIPVVAELNNLVTTENNPINFSISAIDADGDTLNYGISSSSGNATLSLDGNQITYDPDANFTGVDEFSFTVSDGQAFVATTVSVTVSDPATIPGTGNLVWEHDLITAQVSGPVAYHDGKLFLSAFLGDTDIYSFDLSGNLLDRLNVGLHSESAPVINVKSTGEIDLINNTVYNNLIGDSYANTAPIDGVSLWDRLGTYSIDINSDGTFGTMNWGDSSTSDGRDGSPTLNDDGTIVYTADVWHPETNQGIPYLSVIDAESGEILQQIEQYGWAYSSPLFVPNNATPNKKDGMVYIGGEVPDNDPNSGIWGGNGGTGILRAFEANADGTLSSTPVWQYEAAEAPIDRGPSAVRTPLGLLVLFGSEAGVFRAANAETGEIVWTLETGSNGFGTMVVSNDNRTVYALTNGTEQSIDVSSPQPSKLIAINAFNGSIEWTIDAPNNSGTPIVGQDAIYVIGEEEITAINNDGYQIWDFDLSAEPYYGYGMLVDDPAYLDSGLLIFASGTKIIAITTGDHIGASHWSNYRGDSQNTGVFRH